jgi:hypothetical protein
LSPPNLRFSSSETVTRCHRAVLTIGRQQDRPWWAYLALATVTTGFPHRGCDLNRRKAISERLGCWLHARLYLSLSLRVGDKRERFDNRVGRYVLAKFTLTATVMGKRQWRVAKSGRIGWRSSGSS